MKKENDFGRDSIPLLVLKISIPFMIAQFVNVFYSIVDRIYVGNIPGTGADALAGVGVCAPIVTLLSSFGTLFGIGGSVLFSVRLGAGDEKGARRLLANSFAWMLIVSVVLTAVFLLTKGRPAELVRGQRRDLPLCGFLYDDLHSGHGLCPALHGHELFHYSPGIPGAGDDDHADRCCDQYCP